MVQNGTNSISSDSLNFYLDEFHVPDMYRDKIKSNFKAGQKIGFAADIVSLRNIYMKGYY